MILVAMILVPVARDVICSQAGPPRLTVSVGTRTRTRPR